MRFVHVKQIPQQAKIRFVSESATLLDFFIFCAVLDSTNKYLKHCTAQNCSKMADFAEPQPYFVESAICKWNPHFVCGFRLRYVYV